MKRIKERLKEIRFRLVVVYTGILFFFLVCVLIFVSIQNYRQYEKEEQQNIEYIANSVNMQIENYVNQANFILLDTISDRSFINILWEIREQGIEDKMQVYYWVRHLQDCICHAIVHPNAVSAECFDGSGVFRVLQNRHCRKYKRSDTAASMAGPGA